VPPETRSDNTDDEVRRGSASRRRTERSKAARPWPTIDASGHGVEDLTQVGQRSRCDPDILDGSSQSASSHSRSARVTAAQSGDPGCDQATMPRDYLQAYLHYAEQMRSGGVPPVMLARMWVASWLERSQRSSRRSSCLRRFVHASLHDQRCGGRTYSQLVPWHRAHRTRPTLPMPLHCRHLRQSSGITTRNTPSQRRARGATEAPHGCPMLDLVIVKRPQPVQIATGLDGGLGTA
jgi:hypothetical protein